MDTLKDLSKTGRVRPWRAHKKLSYKLIDVYRDLARDPDKKDYFLKKAKLVADCSNYLIFAQCPNGHQNSQRLKMAHFCRQRLCPICQWRRTLLTYHNFLDVAHRAQENNPGIQFVLITLTARNVPADRLQAEINHYMESYKRLIKYKRFSKAIIGTYRTFEITANEQRNDFHPHFHIIGAVNKSYFDSRDYIKHDELMKMWRKAFQVDYDPVVDIRKVRKRDKSAKTVFRAIKEQIAELTPEEQGQAIIQEMANKNSGSETENELSQAGAEVAKYSVKVSAILNQKNRNEVVEVLDSVLYNRRFISYAGILDEARKQLKAEKKLQDIETSDLINVSNDKELCQCSICQTELIEVRFAWKESDYFTLK